MGKADNEGLSLGYRIMWRIRRMTMQMYGPAQLGEGNDPLSRLQQERDRKVAAAKAARRAREAG
jgi:hypothetical protein